MKTKPASEPRLPDLSRQDDLNHPINRLLGIDNYCSVLMDGYRESVGRLRDATNSARIALEVARRGEGDPLADPWHRECARLVRIQLESCEQYHRLLCDLANAMRLAMPDLLLKCKVIALHPARLDRSDNGTDWEAFKSELKIVQLEANRLLDELANPKGPGVGGPTSTATDDPTQTVAEIVAQRDVSKPTVTRWAAENGIRKVKREYRIPISRLPAEWLPRSTPPTRRPKLAEAVEWECPHCSHTVTSKTRPLSCKCGKSAFARTLIKAPAK
ncbi:MAG: hypothetical protein ABSG31_16715 [Tepidisphaeraceae bacterium]|jgi:hypothetical protein